MSKERFSWGTVLFDGGIGVATGGLFHGAGKMFEKASPFVKIAKVTEDRKGKIVRNSTKYKFGLNERHTRTIVFQNKVLEWQREVGLRTE